MNEYGKVLPKSPIDKAVKYCYDIYHRLSRYHLDGRYHIDNNFAENSLRGLALGRKNYLFCGNYDAAKDAAVIYSLLGCCKAADVNLRDWMVHVLSYIHDYDQDYTMDLAELLSLNHLRKTPNCLRMFSKFLKGFLEESKKTWNKIRGRPNAYLYLKVSGFCRIRQ